MIKAKIKALSIKLNEIRYLLLACNFTRREKSFFGERKSTIFGERKLVLEPISLRRRDNVLLGDVCLEKKRINY